jgi:DNA processing protein
LLGRLSGHIELARGSLHELLALDDEELLAAIGGRDRMELDAQLAAFDETAANALRRAAGRTALLCRCDPGYPSSLLELTAPPAVVQLAGDAAGVSRLGESAAIVGARACSPYGRSVAESLGRSLAAAGVPVISGMALGIDAAAHTGALAAPAAALPTVAVLPGPADRPYPASRHRLHQGIVERGAVLAEFGASAPVRRWQFLARNRLIAALATVTIVVEAGERSGSLVTARHAAELGRPLGAVPGRVTDPQSAGTNALLRGGAEPVRGAQDVLDLLFGAGARVAASEARPEPSTEGQAILAAISAGCDSAAALARAGHRLAEISALELDGWLRRGAGGRLTVLP